MGSMTPGIQILTGNTTSGLYNEAVISSTSGVRLRQSAVERITVANQGFWIGQEVFHPSEYGVNTGHVEERHDEPDIAWFA